MTRLGEPILEPGGEMDVSDVLLCCVHRKPQTGSELKLTVIQIMETEGPNPALAQGRHNAIEVNGISLAYIRAEFSPTV